MSQLPLNPPIHQGCPSPDEWMAYIRGGKTHANMEEHLLHCSACRELQQLVHLLETHPTREPSANLTSSVMAAVYKQKQRESGAHSRWRAAAALLLCGLALWSVTSLKQKDSPALAIQPSADVGMREAVLWFCRNQEENGSWDPSRWGGDRRFEVALTALPLLAVLSAEGDKSGLEQNVAKKARDFLISRCDAQGRFSSGFYGSAYTQGIATLALLNYYQYLPDDEVKAVLHRALDVIAGTQQDDGSWSVAGMVQPDLTVSLWQVEALRLATQLGWEEMNPHVSLGTKWLATQRVSEPFHAPWLSAGKFDYFHTYDATLRLRESTDAMALQQLTSIRQALLSKQSQHGEELGSWSPDDRWSAVGGRLYSTAMASLALR